MYKIHDVLIPARFLTYILQVLLTIVIWIQRSDNILMSMDQNESYDKKKKRFMATMIFFYFFELIEFLIMLWGLTLFNNKLSIAQIFFHSICILLLNWYIHEIYASIFVYQYFIVGGVIPILLECISIFTMSIYHRRFTKIE
jgi:hypothetical protein